MKIRKIVFKWSLSAFLSLSVLPTFALTEVVDGIEWTYTVSYGEAMIGDGSYKSPSAVPKTTKGVITIPSMLGGYSVTDIGEYAFYGCSGLTSVAIPDSVTSIGGSAFYGCSGLTSVAIPDSVTSIGEYAFYGCSGLTSVAIPDSVTRIRSYAFANCSGLTSVTIPDSVTSIGDEAFSGCSGLTSVTIPDSVTSIGNNAFRDCSGLTSVTIPDSVTSIGYGAFSGCSGLTSVTIPDSVTSIGGGAFGNCSSLTSVTIPAGVTCIESSVFSYCGSLTSVTIPDGVMSIGAFAFRGCKGLTSVKIPDGVTSIGDSAFYNCSGLASVIIPDSVTSVGSSAFTWCSGLTSVTIGSCVTRIWDDAFEACGNLMSVVFRGDLPDGIEASGLLDSMQNNSLAYMKWPRAYRGNYTRAGYLKYFAGFTGEENLPSVTITSVIRANDPTIMDVAYYAVSEKPTVKIRALAFEDGERSFAKVVRPETFVNDTDGNPTAQNVGDNIAANVTNALSWKVSSDWATRLAKVKFEVLACDGALLPMETTIIPVSDRYGKMQISWNRHTNDQIFDALMWLYADKAAGLTLENGALKAGGKTLVNGTEIVDGKAAAEFVYRAMGFDGVLSGDLLNYVNEETRLGLSPDGVRQYAYKFIEE